MSIESADDWKGLRRAGHIAHLTLDALEASVRPDVSTAELDAVAARIFADTVHARLRPWCTDSLERC